MTEPMASRIGVVVNRALGVERALTAARRVEARGFGSAWLTNGGPEDCMPVLAVLASHTPGLRLGTSVVQTYPRHPYVLATETNVIDQLAPGRFRLGVGPSHDLVLQGLGIRREAPFDHLREYVTVLRTLFDTGSVDFAGAHYRVHAVLGRTVPVPVMIGTLQPKTFELAGAIADGAITWLCPPAYLERVGLPALERGAAESERARPPLVAHVAACVHDDAEEVRQATRDGIPNIRFPSYQRMLVAAGLDDAVRGEWTDELVDRVIAGGSPEHVVGRVRELFEAGADEVLVRPMGAGSAPDHVVDLTLDVISRAFGPAG